MRRTTPTWLSSLPSWCVMSLMRSLHCASRSPAASRPSRTWPAVRRSASWQLLSCGSASTPPASSTASLGAMCARSCWPWCRTCPRCSLRLEQELVRFLRPSSCTRPAWSLFAREGPVVPMLRYVGSKGNTTVYEWRTGLEPARVEKPEMQVVPKQPKEDTIDWGDFTLEPIGGGDTDNTAAGGEAQDNEIDWGIVVEPSPQDNGIDWGDAESNEAQITVLEDGSEELEAVARGSDALTLLENAATRNQFIDELMELELFLAQRLVEMEEEADVLAASQFQLAPAVLQGQTSTRVGTLLASTRALLDQLSTRRMQHLFIILASPRYVDRVSEMLQQKLNQAELLLAKREALSRKRQEALTEQGVLEPKLDRLQERTRELQQLIEADISKRYGGRPVHLMGVSL
ncbi:CDK5 regulatory subunit-associated protein 3 isoform X3 [Centrocercus urophasianus]|uniref:CDK5 regulatory subunit-associated protein 3 isoform X3 n=1 Tax=Centrocercus urophasianus TaxID=9002 RepID=UPI001C64D604|nr:CDK5 regulatory subunit-associated protein 3 isoform X3 [Centrocercus urophasianus]